MRVLYCNCTYADVVPLEVKRQVLKKLSASRVTFDAVADLCEISARNGPFLKRIAAEDDVRIAACFPRAVRCLFDAGGAPLPEQHVEILNMRLESAANVVSRLLAEKTPRQAQPS
jgi:heterodisulfide reductase subunit A-like polyferredoxin